jgi:hypothetical protein
VYNFSVSFCFALDREAGGNVGGATAAHATSKHGRTAVNIFFHNKLRLVVLVIDRVRREATAASRAISANCAEMLSFDFFHRESVAATGTTACKIRAAQERMVHIDHRIVFPIMNSDVKVTTTEAST